MKLFKYVLVVGFGVMCYAPNLFADDTNKVNVIELQHKADQGDTEAQISLANL